MLDNDYHPRGLNITILSATNGTNGIITLSPDGTIEYLPDPNWSGTDLFSYTIVDSEGNQATAQVTINVLGRGNSPPVASDDSATTGVGQQVQVQVLDNDTDPDVGTTLSVQGILSGPSFGTVTLNPGE